MFSTACIKHQKKACLIYMNGIGGVKQNLYGPFKFAYSSCSVSMETERSSMSLHGHFLNIAFTSRKRSSAMCRHSHSKIVFLLGK
jgi:hypothetical protein